MKSLRNSWRFKRTKAYSPGVGLQWAVAQPVQQTAIHTAMDKYMPPEWRHRIALYADDMAAGADTLEELFEIYKALVKTLAKAGIQSNPAKWNLVWKR